MWFSTSFDITWYAEAVIYVTLYSFWITFSEQHMEGGRVNLRKCEKIDWGEK